MIKKKKKNILYKKITTRKLVIFLVILLIITTVVLFKEGLFVKKQIEERKQIIEERCTTHLLLDGSCSIGDEKKLPLAVMIDNHPDAWPQYGLSKASIVYNTLVEGGTTRMMAVFDNFLVEKVGPIRSSRPYFLTWVTEYDALYAHVGGSSEALTKIKSYNINDLNEMTTYGPRYLFRDDSNGYFMPHNVFTNGEKIKKAFTDFELASTTPSYNTWNFDKKNTTGTQYATSIYIDYSAMEIFDIEYTYSTSTDSYLRWQNGDAFVEAQTGDQIQVKTVIIQHVPKEMHLDAEDRLAIETMGKGDALIFVNGQKIEATWQKNDLRSRTMFYDKLDKPIIFTPGNIWIEVVPQGRQVTIK